MLRSGLDLDRDPTAGVTHHRPDDRFVPVRACELVGALADDADRFGLTADQVQQIATALHDVIVQESAAFQQALGDTYAGFNPDRDTQPLEPLDEIRTPPAYAAFCQRLAYLLDKANFRRLSDVQVDQAIATANSHGLRIRLHPERVAELLLWVRGRGTITRTRRDWRRWRHWKRWQDVAYGEELELPVYRRLAVVARLKDDPHVVIKLFKDIPDEDIEGLLPHAEVDMGIMDRLVVFGSGAGALGSTASKLLGVFTGVAALGQLVWVLLVGLISLAVKTFLGYRRARKTRDSQRTQHLYFQNLANNASALQMLAVSIAQEEFKEALLAYVFCHAAQDAPRDEQGLDRAIEHYIHKRFDARVDFDCSDALESLTRLDLKQAAAALRAIAPDEAIRRLRDHWRARRTVDYHEGEAAKYSATVAGFRPENMTPAPPAESPEKTNP